MGPVKLIYRVCNYCSGSPQTLIMKSKLKARSQQVLPQTGHLLIKRKPTKMSRLKFFMDLGGDGKVTVVDFVAWQLLIVFGGVSVAALYVFADRLLLTIYGKSTEYISTYSIPLSQVMGTLVTLVYTFAFMYSSKEASVTASKRKILKIFSFLDVNKDGRLTATDWLCCLTGVTHAAILLVNVYLFFTGHLTTPDVVALIAANTSLIIIFLSNSFLAHMTEPEKKSNWRFFFNIHHDNAFHLVDMLAILCNVAFFSAVTYCFIILVFQPLGHSDVWSLIALTGQMNFILISAFASAYLSNGNMSMRVELALSVYAVIYMVLLLRTVWEMSTVPTESTFNVITSLANNMVLGVTQLVMGSYVVHDSKMSTYKK